jgi:hypothetical protein
MFKKIKEILFPTPVFVIEEKPLRAKTKKPTKKKAPTKKAPKKKALSKKAPAKKRKK